MTGQNSMPALETPQITTLGEFGDPVWELRYLQHAWPEARRLIRVCAVFGGIIFFLAGIGDLMALGLGTAFLSCLAGRLLALASAAYPLVITNQKKYNPAVNTAVLVLILAFDTAMCIFTIAKFHTMGTLPITAVVMVVVFLVVPPVKMFHLIIGTLTIAVSFVICFGFSNNDATPHNVTIISLLLVLIIGLCTVAISRQNALRRRAFIILVHSEELGEKYRQVVENASEGIMIAQDGYLRYANPWMQNKTGYTFEEITSQPFTNMIHAEDRQYVIETHLNRIAGKPVPPKSRFRVVTKTGDTRWMEISGVIIDWENQTAALNFMSDISEQMQAQEQALAQERIDAAIQTAGAACHELNQPLQNVLMQAELTMMSLDEEHPLFQRLDRIMKAANEMTAVTQRLNRITSFHTKAYVGGSQILDLDRSAGGPVEDDVR